MFQKRVVAMTCRTCGGEMIQRSRWRLFLVGVLMMAAISLAAIDSYLWVPGVLFLLVGAYLVVWATLGKGLWCRGCKKFNFY